ncbi:MAG: hypothetical protein PHE88_03985 [Elusimicrobia bacterium]|nr:hypothetical protein [Elusimicrobiota bacterium]
MADASADLAEDACPPKYHWWGAGVTDFSRWGSTAFDRSVRCVKKNKEGKINE